MAGEITAGRGLSWAQQASAACQRLETGLGMDTVSETGGGQTGNGGGDSLGLIYSSSSDDQAMNAGDGREVKWQHSKTALGCNRKQHAEMEHLHILLWIHFTPGKPEAIVSR